MHGTLCYRYFALWLDSFVNYVYSSACYNRSRVWLSFVTIALCTPITHMCSCHQAV